MSSLDDGSDAANCYVFFPGVASSKNKKVPLAQSVGFLLRRSVFFEQCGFC